VLFSGSVPMGLPPSHEERITGLALTPLALAAAEDDGAAVQRLLQEHGAAVDHQNRRGRTALMAALEAGALVAVEVLLRFGAAVATVDWAGLDARLVAGKAGTLTAAARELLGRAEALAQRGPPPRLPPVVAAAAVGSAAPPAPPRRAPGGFAGSGAGSAAAAAAAAAPTTAAAAFFSPLRGKKHSLPGGTLPTLEALLYPDEESRAHAEEKKRAADWRRRRGRQRGGGGPGGEGAKKRAEAFNDERRKMHAAHERGRRNGIAAHPEQEHRIACAWCAAQRARVHCFNCQADLCDACFHRSHSAGSRRANHRSRPTDGGDAAHEGGAAAAHEASLAASRRAAEDAIGVGGAHHPERLESEVERARAELAGTPARLLFSRLTSAFCDFY